MNAEKIMTALCLIDDKYILDCSEEKPKSCAGMRRLLPVAACFVIVLAVTLTALTTRFGRSWTNPEQNNGGTTVKSDFVIENGELKRYLGHNPDVVIPDEVTKIDSAAFSDLEDPSSITTLSIGKNVSSIDSDAFFDLTGLTDVSVDGDNEYYSVDQGALFRLDGSQVFNISRDHFDENAFFTLLNSLDFDGEYGNKTITVIFGKVTITVYCANAPDEWDRANCCRIRKIEYMGNVVETDDQFYGNCVTQLLYSEADGIFVYTHTEGGKYIFTPDSVTKVEEPRWEDYNGNVYTFSYDDENGRITYVRKPQKYSSTQEYISFLNHCVSRDEFYMETGFLKNEYGNVVFIPEHSYTLNEKLKETSPFGLDIDEMFNNVRSFFDSYETLDELIAHNATKYEKAR